MILYLSSKQKYLLFSLAFYSSYFETIASYQQEIQNKILPKLSIFLPQPKDLQEINYQDQKYLNKNKNIIVELIIKGKCFIDQEKFHESINLFKNIADNYRDYQSMYYLGEICEKHGQFNLAIKWYVSSFQAYWFENLFSTSNEFNSCLPYEALKKISKNDKIEKAPRKFLNNLDTFFSLHLPASNKIEKHFKCNSLAFFYENGGIEPHLSQEENNLKNIDFKTRGNFIGIFSPYDYTLYELSEKFLDQGITFVEQKKYKKARKCLLKCTIFPDASHNLGFLHEEGYIGKRKDGLPNYSKAAELYENAKTINSFGNLGGLYKNGHIGQIEGKPDYQKAKIYLKYSSNPESLCNLGILYKEGHLGKVDNYPNYQKAKAYFEKSNTGSALVRIAELYIQDVIKLTKEKSNFEEAKNYLEKAIKKQFPKAYVKISYLYLEGYIGKLSNQPNYQKAKHYLKKGLDFLGDMEPTDLSALYHNLGNIYIHSNERNYQKAKDYLEKAKTPESYYNIGNLYAEGLIENPPNYDKAFKFYEESNNVRANLEILGLNQLGYINKNLSEEEKNDFSKKVIENIDKQLLELPDRELFYIKGVAEYYLGNWESAFISLQYAFLLGNDEKELLELMKEIENSFVSSELLIEQETQDKDSEIKVKEDEIENKDKKSSFQKKILYTKIEKLTKHQKSICKARKNRQKFLTIKDINIVLPPPVDIELLFENEKDKEEFLNFRNENKKLEEILNDIKTKYWSTYGSGKPEVLKYDFKGYKGCISRRLDEENRLIYKITSPGKILILSWKRHY